MKIVDDEENKMPKKFFQISTNLGWCLFLTVFFYSVGTLMDHRPQCAEIVDRIIAVVNDDVITLSELNALIKPFEKKIKSYGYTLEKELKMLYQLREEKLSQLIGVKLADQEIKKLELTVSDKEIDDAMERIKKANYFTDEDLRKALAREGSSIEEYENQLKQQILKSKLVNYTVKSKIVITKEDIKSYYNSNTEQYAGKIKYHLRNVLMKVPAFTDSESKKAVFDKMEAVVAQLKEGRSFEEIAKMYSQSPLASTGGDLGLIGIDVFSKQLREAIEGLKKGEFTATLDTEQGYQIFFVQDIVKDGGKSLSEATPEIEEKLYNKVVEKKYQEWLENLYKQAHIKEKL